MCTKSVFDEITAHVAFEARRQRGDEGRWPEYGTRRRTCKIF